MGNWAVNGEYAYPSPSPKGRGELGRRCNLTEKFLGMVQDELILETENGVTHRAQVGVALRIFRDDFRRLVNVSVHLDIQFVLGAAEVGDVIPDLVLPPELQPLESPVAQQFPGNVLRRCLLLP